MNGGGFSGSSVDLFSESRALAGGTPGNSKNEKVTLGQGATLTVLSYSGSAGYLSSLWFALAGTGTSLEDSVLKITVDGESSPAISLRVPLYFAAEYLNTGSTNFQSRFVGGNQGGGGIGLYSFIPVPFNSSITVTLTNGDASNSMTVWSEANYTSGVADSWPLAHKQSDENDKLADSRVLACCLFFTGSGIALRSSIRFRSPRPLTHLQLSIFQRRQEPTSNPVLETCTAGSDSIPTLRRAICSFTTRHLRAWEQRLASVRRGGRS